MNVKVVLATLLTTADVASGTPVQVDEIGTIRGQAASLWENAFEINRRQLVLGCQSNDQIAMKKCQSAGCQDQAPIR